MPLYRDFASQYDFIFPSDETTVNFLHQSFPQGSLLDLGCATGGYSLALAQLGYSVEGIDLDERMIEIANAKVVNKNLSIRFRVENILHLQAKNYYTGIYCIGNTLVHLNSKQDIVEMLSLMYDALVSGGTAVVQIVNYDRILDQHIEQLPTIRHLGRQFERHYRWQTNALLFRTRLTYETESFVGEARLIPLRSKELLEAFRTAGFTHVESFGDFDREEFDPSTSFAFVVKAIKS